MKYPQNTGLSIEFPIRMKDIPETYAYLRALCSIQEGLSFKRIGAIESVHFPNLLDKYEFLLGENHICFLFVYSYHIESLPIVPFCFKTLNPSIDNSIFNNLEEDSYREKKEDERLGIGAIVRLILLKNGVVKDDHVIWTPAKSEGLLKLLEQKGFTDNFEDLVMNDWFNLHESSNQLSPIEFEQSFVLNFHHIKIAKFTPDFIKDRNSKIEIAFNQIKETIHRIQAWQDNEKVRVRIESDYLKSIKNFSYISQITTAFIVVVLGCDSQGRFQLTYGLDSNHLKILPDDMASTLIRRIYQFTPGEMEPFVSIISLSMDCISLFENLLNESKSNPSIKIIEVQRNPYNSIEEMLNGIDFKDDVDEETKKLFGK